MKEEEKYLQEGHAVRVHAGNGCAIQGMRGRLCMQRTQCKSCSRKRKHTCERYGCATTCGVVNAASQGGNTLMRILLQTQDEHHHLGLFAVGVVVMIVDASFSFMVVAVVEVAVMEVSWWWWWRWLLSKWIHSSN